MNRQLTDNGQFRLLAVLLAMVVVLPTVCLLWFMTRAMKNERLAVRDRLVRLYEDELNRAVGDIDILWANTFEQLDIVLKENHSSPAAMNQQLLSYFDAAVIYDGSGQRIYPLLRRDIVTGDSLGTAFRDIWQVEYGQRNYEQAARMYAERAKTYSSSLRLSAYIAQARCLKKMERPDEAAEVLKGIAFGKDVQYADVLSLMRIADARLMLVDIRKDQVQNDPATLRKWLMSILTIEEESDTNTLLPIEQKLFLTEKVLERYRAMIPKEFPERQKDMERIEERYASDQILLPLAEEDSDSQSPLIRSTDQIQPIMLNEKQYYALRHSAGNRSVLLICDRVIDQARKILSDRFNASDVTFRITNGSYWPASEPLRFTEPPFVQRQLGGVLDHWKVELYFLNAGVFDQAARRQGLLYWWTGGVSILFIVAAGLLAGRMVTRQLRLNRLKNDFIATVTHELKTPLASMRVLVDTLRQNRTRDEQQVKDYFELIARENARLSRLIDNFLSFSRMERNKQSFDLVEVNPVEIACTAVESIKTKYKQNDCCLQLEQDASVPFILADFDAIVTVLINLLDNACKYSGDIRQVRLRVFSHEKNVCFSVTDRGIGLSKRAQRKIFKRFYRVDQRLSRQTEGCGLGLSIVQYIINAHHGSITVDSQLNRGSTFIVILPALNGN